MASALILISGLITVIAILIGAAWKLLSSLNAIDKRISNLETSLARDKLAEREWMGALVEHSVKEHQNACFRGSKKIRQYNY